MVEYFYDYIKVSAGEENVVCAMISEEDGTAIISNCDFTLYDNFGNILAVVEGIYYDEPGYWAFAIPAIEETGRYYYAIGNNGTELMFKKPFYVA